jgi:tryptophan halogenase|tara:strand:- start:2165 stop:3781 length:1617 start_codon:yes stop_codon:yes gene_type:complete
MKIKTVTIVGGGSSGWMTAAALAKCCPHLDITLIESKSIGTVGVGESTLGHINRYMRLLDLKDEDWMAACNATYKNSIQFTNFREGNGEVFQYPFSDGLDMTDKPSGPDNWKQLAALRPEEYGPEEYARFFCTGNTLLAEHNKQTKNENGVLRNFDYDNDTAYHMDAQLFGQYLKDNIAIPLGVKHMYGEVHSHMKDNTNTYITQILCADGTILKADLFVDCTGFASILLEQWMGSHFRSFENHLANDKAWACRLPYTNREEQMHNVTDCFALGNGWVWNIPLWNRIGTGYVYSSRFTTPEAAKVEFREHLAKTHTPEIAEAAEMFEVKIRHGRRHRAWKGNVVGVGLSYGFVEPLESTGLLTTHENVIKLVDLLNRRDGFVSRSEKEGFNFSAEFDVIKFRDFVSQHYAMSMREDTPYWRWCTELNEYSPEMHADEMQKHGQWANMFGNIIGAHSYEPSHVGNNMIAAGMGLRPTGTPSLLTASNRQLVQLQEEVGAVDRMYQQYKNFVIEHIKDLPTHYQFLLENIYGGNDEHKLD